MKEEAGSRLRLLYLYRLLQTETDEDHRLTTGEIIAGMRERFGISMHRTTVPADIRLLREAGIEILSVRRQAWEYYLADRHFSVPELRLLIDAVRSSGLITRKKSEELTGKLLKLAGRHAAALLERTAHTTRYVKPDNEMVYYIVDGIQEALQRGRKISLYYRTLGPDKQWVLKNDGAPYTVSPYDLVWNGDYYYLVGLCAERGSVRSFRVDRIARRPDILEEPAAPRPADYDPARYSAMNIRMFYAGKPEEIVLLCENGEMNHVVDQFGMDVRTERTDAAHFRAVVRVSPGPTFYRWVFTYGGRIRILSPAHVRGAYIGMLTEALKSMTSPRIGHG